MPTITLDPHVTIDLSTPPRVECGVTFIPGQWAWAGVTTFPAHVCPAHICPSCGRCKDCGQPNAAPPMPYAAPYYPTFPASLGPHWIGEPIWMIDPMGTRVTS